MFFGVALLVGGWRVVGWGRKSYLGPAEISSFSSRDLSRRNKHDSIWLVSTRYFYILFLWAIVVSDFLPLEIHKHLVLPLSSITFTANGQADNHFYDYIYLVLLFQYYTAMVYRKNWKWSTRWNIFTEKIFFSVDHLKINELHVAHMTSHVIWVDEVISNVGSYIYKKGK